jgi:hypothetical protein
MTPRRLLILSALVALALNACATTAPLEPKHYGVDNTAVGIEAATRYSSTANSGSQYVFQHAHAFVTAQANGGICWVKRHTADETPGAVSSPVPSANSWTATSGAGSGWLRLRDGQPTALGREGLAATSNELTKFVSCYCETAGADCLLVGH